MRAWFAAVGVVLAGGCGGSEACADFAEGVLMTALMTDNGETARVEVELRRAELGEESIPVKLCQGNSLRVDDLDLTWSQRPSGATVYDAVLPELQGAQASEHVFELGGDDGVGVFTAANPATAFTVTAPEDGAEVPRGAALEIHWDPPRGADEQITVKVADAIDGDACLGAPIELAEPDDGEVVLAAAKVEAAELKSEPSAVCEALVTLSRQASTTLERQSGEVVLDPGSRAVATTSRTRSFVSVP